MSCFRPHVRDVVHLFHNMERYALSVGQNLYLLPNPIVRLWEYRLSMTRVMVF